MIGKILRHAQVRTAALKRAVYIEGDTLTSSAKVWAQDNSEPMSKLTPKAPGNLLILVTGKESDRCEIMLFTWKC